MTYKNYRHKIITPNRLCTRLENSNFALSWLNDTLKKNIELNQLISPIIENEASVKVTVTRYENGILDLAVPNQSVANHLHYLRTALIDSLKKQEELSELRHITTFVEQNTSNRLYELHNNTNIKQRNRLINSETTASMTVIANHAIHHDKLKSELLKLAKNLNTSE